jgi:hypothetical protein
MLWDDEILNYARGCLSDSEFAALSNEVNAARKLPSDAMTTAIRIALAKYPQTRKMVSQLAHDPATGTLRGEWLSREDWIELDTTQTEADNLVRRFLNGEIPASDLDEAAQIATVKELLLSHYNDVRIMDALDLSPRVYERIRRRVEQGE